jgi:hypothetical protein
LLNQQAEVLTDKMKTYQRGAEKTGLVRPPWE